jgi:hypothetical protein
MMNMRRVACFWIVVVLRLTLGSMVAPAFAQGIEGGAGVWPVAIEPGVIERTRRSVVQVFANGSAGSGFFVKLGDAVFVVTNLHVVEAALQLSASSQTTQVAGIQVRTALGAQARAAVWKLHRDHDIALLRVDQIPTGAMALEIRTGAVSPGEEVVAWGAPHGVALVPLDGEVERTVRMVGPASHARNPVDTILVRISIAPGNSGGPLLDRAGRVVGVITGRQQTSGGVGAGMAVATASTEFAGAFQRFNPREADIIGFGGAVPRTETRPEPAPEGRPDLPPATRQSPPIAPPVAPHTVVPAPGPVSDFALGEAQARTYACAQRLRLPPVPGRFAYNLHVPGFPRLLHFPAGQARVVAANMIAPQHVVLTIAGSRDGGDTFVCVVP